MDDGIVRVAGHEQHLRFRSRTCQAPCQFTAIHLRHYHVSKHQMDNSRLTLTNLQRFFTLACSKHRVAARSKYRLDERAERILILNHKDRFPALKWRRGGCGRLNGRRSVLNPRKVDFERCALLRLTVNPDEAAT